jgi:hypothetical protein
MNTKSVRLLAIAISALLVVSTFSAAFVNVGMSSQPGIEPKNMDEDVKSAPLKVDPNEPVEPLPDTHHSYWALGAQAYWTYYYSGVGVYVYAYRLEYIGTNVEIWVQTGARGINFPPGDPRNGPDGVTRPTYAMLQYLADQYEQVILPKESEFFGAPLFHDGTNAQLQYLSPTIPDDPEYYHEPTGRAVILVCNIRDTNYFNPNYGLRVIGVHIGAYEDVYYDRNVITLDAYSWYHQLGPEGTVWGEHYCWLGWPYYENPPGNYTHPVTSPYAYDSTVAHEFQHLLHYELCPNDDIWMNEGCSMYAEFLCGYGIDPQYPNEYFYCPDNSLTVWGDLGPDAIIGDYGAVGLWCMYLADRYGAPFLSQYFTLGGGGIGGIDAALQVSHHKERFPEVYRDWKLANLMRADCPGGGKYNYKSIDFNDPIYLPVRLYEVSGLPVAPTTGTSFGNTFTTNGYDTYVSRIAGWGSDYIAFRDWSRPGFLYFDGDDTAQVPFWTLTSNGWYSGTGYDLANFLIAGSAYVNPADPTLTIVTAYGLETLWDFGFVQVSTDGGNTWTSLANDYTTSLHDPSAHPDIIANLPGLTDYNPDFPDWTTMSFDLAAYAGQTVKIGFRYMTDWGTTYEGWWINSATVSGAAVTLAPVGLVIPVADFQVTVLQAIVVCKKTLYVPYDMKLNHPANKGMTIALANSPSYVILIVTPTGSDGTNDYKFQATKLPLFKFC